MGFGVPRENRAAEHLESLAPCTRKDVHLSFSYFLGSIHQIGWISLPREEHWDFLGVRGAGATWQSSKVAAAFSLSAWRWNIHRGAGGLFWEGT